VLFHPLFVPAYIAWFLIEVEPYFFGSALPARKILTIAQFFIIYAFFPLVTVLLAKALGFLKSIHLHTQKDRIIPYIACEIYYFWMCYVFRHQSDQYSPEIIQFSMAIFIATSLALIANIYIKISMHSIGMGIVLVFLSLLSINEGSGYTVYLSAWFLITGLVCTSRLIVSDHTPGEIYWGLLLGGASQIIAVWADGILP